MRHTVRWWNGLSIEVAGVITLTAAIGCVVLLVVVLGAQRHLLTEQTLSDAAFLSDTIVSGLQRHMFRNERTELNGSLREISGQPFITGLRLFDAGGRTHFSTVPGEVGRMATTTDGACALCHEDGRAPGALKTNERSRIVQGVEGRVLTTVTPIYNRPGCSTAACHAHTAEQRVLGVLEVGLSLSRVDATMGTLQRTTGTVGLATIVGLCVLTIVITRRKVLAPVEALAAGVKRVMQGDYQAPVEVTGSSEIADLARAFNEMEGSLRDVRLQRRALLDSLEQQVRDRTAALEQAQDRLIRGEKLSSLGRLSASIAHEINNPLAGILTYAKLMIRTLQEGPPDTPTREKLVSRLKLVERETQRCTAIVRNLLDFARERQLTLADVDVNAAIGEALFLIHNQITLQNIRLEQDLRPLRPIQADFGQVRQALANILINACDAMSHGGTLRVGSCQTPDGQVEVTVRDSGIGISPEHLQKVLDPFFTTKEKGTGLGLSVVYGIVERHGGKVSIDSTIGSGTTVTIRLPASHAELTCRSTLDGLATTTSP
jgi:two-component system NtrC family sensor kinase